jgi:hypothetical protein
VMTPQQIDEYKKRKAAIHEAGHALLALAGGANVRAWIHRNESGKLEEKTWLGHAQQVQRFCWVKGQPTFPDDRKASDSAYYVAGMVAEWMDAEAFEEDSPEDIREQIFDLWDVCVGGMSPSDLAGFSGTRREQRRAVLEAIKILREQKPLFNRIVSELLKHESLTDGQMSNLATRLLIVTEPTTRARIRRVRCKPMKKPAGKKGRK